MAMRMFCAVLVWFTLVNIPASRIGGQTLTAEDSAVLEALLTTSCETASGGYWVISREANSADRVPDRVASAVSAAASHAIDRSARSPLLPFVECPGLRWESMADIDAARRASTSAPRLEPPNPGWEGFYARYPRAQGIIRVSLPGYSADGTVAAVFFSASAGSLASASSWRELRKVQGVWQQVGFYPGAVG
jgi:hypothetical protein